MTDTQQTVTAEKTVTAPASKPTAGADTTAENVQGNDHHSGNGKGGGGHGCCGGHGQGRSNWQDKRRLKMIGAVVLIALVGFMLGRGSAHHRGDHMEGRYGNRHHQMEFSRGEQAAPSLSTILDGIAASPEQRSKAVELFR